MDLALNPAPTVRRPLAEVVSAGLRAFRGLGLSRQESFDTLRALLYGELRGGKSQHGLERFSWIGRNIGKAFVPGRAMTVEHEDAGRGFIRLCGHGGWGYSHIYSALLYAEAALETRQSVYIGLVESYPANCMGDYASILANMGYCAYVGSVSPKRVALPDGRAPRLSTCGQAFAFPGDPPVVLDFSIGAMTNGEILRHRRHGVALPAGHCLDGEGRPTTDAAAVVEADGAFIGSILPRGGEPAGAILAGLGIVMTMHAIETGISGGDSGSFILARRPLPGMKEAVEAFRAQASAGEPGVRLPGDHSGTAARRILSSGVLGLDRQLWESIATAAADQEPLPTDGTDADEMLRQLGAGSYRPLEARAMTPFSDGWERAGDAGAPA